MISSYACDHMTADASSCSPRPSTRPPRAGSSGGTPMCCAIRIRQSFKPGEITPEEANRVGYETAMRWTKGKYAFFVATTQTASISTTTSTTTHFAGLLHKFRDFIGSARAGCGRLSDRVCLENDLSVIVNPKLHSKGRFLHYGAWLGTERQLSYKERLRHAHPGCPRKRPPRDSQRLFAAHGGVRLCSQAGPWRCESRSMCRGQQRATRLRSSTLGEGYNPEDIRAVIAGKRPLPELGGPAPTAPVRVNLIVDIQERLRSGKGPAYERWAKVYNLKQMAAALQFMQEHQISEYSQLSEEAEAASARFHALAEQLRQTEADLAHTSELMGAVVQYAKTGQYSTATKRPSTAKNIWPHTRRSWPTTGRAKAALNDLLGGVKAAQDARPKRKTPHSGGAEKGAVCGLPGGAAADAGGRGGQGQYRPSAGCDRPAQE